MLFTCNSKDNEKRTCNKKLNTFVANKEGTSANQLMYIIEEYGNVTRIKTRSGNRYQVKKKKQK